MKMKVFAMTFLLLFFKWMIHLFVINIAIILMTKKKTHANLPIARNCLIISKLSTRTNKMLRNGSSVARQSIIIEVINILLMKWRFGNFEKEFFFLKIWCRQMTNVAMATIPMYDQPSHVCFTPWMNVSFKTFRPPPLTGRNTVLSVACCSKIPQGFDVLPVWLSISFTKKKKKATGIIEATKVYWYFKNWLFSLWYKKLLVIPTHE